MKTGLRPAFLALFFAWLVYLLSYVSRMSWPPIIPLASHDLGINATQAGSFMTAFYIGYVLTQIPGGFLTDRYGYRKVLLGSLFIIGISTLLTSFTATFTLGFLTRVLAGVGSGAIFSAGLLAITDWFPQNRRGLANGLFMTSTSLGVSLVNLYVPTLSKGYGWRTSFLVSGLLPLLGFILAFFLLKERTPVTQQSTEAKDNKSYWQDVILLFKNRNLLLTGIAGFGGQWATLGIATWANAYLNKSLHLSLVQAGLFMSFFGTAALLCKPITGILSDIVNRKTLSFWILLLLGPILLWFGVNQNISYLYFLLPIIGILGYAFYPPLNTLICDSVDKKFVGTASGLVNAMWQLGALIAPLAVGAVIDMTHNYFFVFATLGAGPVLGAFAILFVKGGKSPVVQDKEKQVAFVEATQT
ncbi:MFS transporter [Aneurinibacillus sp. Ricciae_BoGa-3]|uniref:MFS transporter n=1 Tax=Aneurinibacillus sp. Ricciae_BoGa-3 TaxID=3022697 RepID=UPI0023419C4A|nr:MFS transporter [Aneurinibacillus sp. Ricciae_BoGa-3]WCK56678.1 MFS transporter [Aneurinibacillus sp. Ricciae_BoGa-3]